MYVVLTADNCSRCDAVKRMVKAMSLTVKFDVATGEFLEALRIAGARSYPVLIYDQGEYGFSLIAQGAEVADFIGMNQDKFKK